MKKVDLLEVCLKHNAFSLVKPVRKYLCERTDLNKDELEYLLELSKFDIFSHGDMKTMDTNWSRYRWSNLMKKGMIEIFKERSYRNRYRSYKLSYKAKRIINDYYKYCIGIKQL